MIEALSILTAALVPSLRMAQTITTLDFEGLQNAELIGNYYNGGPGGLGSGPGPNYGITFSGSQSASIDSDVPGGTGDFGGEPTPSTAALITMGGVIMNVPAGFTTGFSF